MAIECVNRVNEEGEVKKIRILKPFDSYVCIITIEPLTLDLDIYFIFIFQLENKINFFFIIFFRFNFNFLNKSIGSFTIECLYTVYIQHIYDGVYSLCVR